MKNPFRSLLSRRADVTPTDTQIKKSVLDVLPEGIIICDAQADSNSIFYANPAFLAFHSCTHGEIIGQKVCHFFSNIINSNDARNLSVALKELSSSNHTFHLNQLGANRWVDLRIEPMLRDDGSLNYYVLTQSDVTDIHKAKLALRENNRQLKKLVSTQHQRINEHELQIGVMFDQAMDAMILLNENNQVLDANDSALALFDQPRTELLGLDIENVLTDLKPNQIQNQLDQVPMYQEVSLEDALSIQVNGYVILLSGATRYISIKNRKYIVITLHDRSSEHVAKMELQRNRSELEEVLRNFNLATQAGGIGIWSWDFESNELSWDERMYEIYGVDPGESENNYTMWQERVHPHDVSHAEEALLHAKETLSQFIAEFRIQMPDGEIRWIKAAADVIFDQDNTTPIGMGGVNIDITKEKNAQASLRAESEIAQAANEAKSMFLANMSHEIRTPMNGVVGMLSLLSETSLETEQRTMVGTIKDSALTLLHIINDILDFSKIEAGQMSLESAPVELQTLLERSLDVLHLQASNKGIEMYLTYDADLPKVIMSDSVRLSQIMLNLIGNAVKFTDSTDEIQGKIWVSASLGSNGIAPCIDLIVEDNGIGMTKEQLSKLFKAFTQADTSTTRLYGGTGLGLSITQSLLELMGGSIHVESEFGVSSRFSLEIPFIEVESTPEDITREHLSGTRILMVTNNQNVNTFCDINLSNYDCKLHTVSSLPRAIKVLKHAKDSDIRIDILLIGPDFYDTMTQNRLSDSEQRFLSGFKCILFSSVAGEKTGFIMPNLYVMNCSPFKPSELTHAIAAIKGLISPDISHQQVDTPALKSHEEKEGLILVVDDQATNRDVLQRQLSYLGYQSELASHGQEALQMIKERHFDLILTDCHMPIMDGYELTKQIRQLEQQDRNRGHIPIVAITANAMVEASEQCMTSGMDDYLTKPVELKTLNSTIEKWMTLAPLVSIDSSKANDDFQDIATSASSSPICLNSLRDILGTTEPDVISPLLEGYWDSVTEDLHLAEEALIQKDELSLQQVAHAAKGAARSAGANDLAKTFEYIQNTATTKDWRSLTDTLNQSRKEAERIKVYLVKSSIIEDTELSL